MAFVMEKIEDRRHVRLEFEGRVTILKLEQDRTVLKSILHESDGYRKALVDMRKAFLAVSTIDFHRFISSYRNELPAGFQIAVIVQPGDWTAATFAENVACNRGIYMRMFRNDLHARAWLGISDND